MENNDENKQIKQSLYEILNVPREADLKQIKSSYKKLSLKWHPDKWSNAKVSQEEKKEANRKFLLISNAYNILSDSEKRADYDAGKEEIGDSLMTPAEAKKFYIKEVLDFFKENNISKEALKVLQFMQKRKIKKEPMEII